SERLLMTRGPLLAGWRAPARASAAHRLQLSEAGGTKDMRKALAIGAAVVCCAASAACGASSADESAESAAEEARACGTGGGPKAKPCDAGSTSDSGAVSDGGATTDGGAVRDGGATSDGGATPQTDSG